MIREHLKSLDAVQLTALMGEILNTHHGVAGPTPRLDALINCSHDAVLMDWSLDTGGQLHGKIYGDSKGRFPNGAPIITSVVQSITKGIAVTKSGTRYRLT